MFDPTIPHDLLWQANRGLKFNKVTELTFDTTFATGGILNIPFIKRQADAVTMRSTFWIQDVIDPSAKHGRRLRMQYLQIVMLDFFPRRDGLPGRIGWPHVSINTLDKVY